MVFCMRLKYIDIMGGGRKDDSVYHLLDAARLLFCKSMARSERRVRDRGAAIEE